MKAYSVAAMPVEYAVKPQLAAAGVSKSAAATSARVSR